MSQINNDPQNNNHQNHPAASIQEAFKPYWITSGGQELPLNHISDKRNYQNQQA